MNIFEEQVIANNMDSEEILNWYRNLYFNEPTDSERHMVAMAINDILPKYVKMKGEER